MGRWRKFVVLAGVVAVIVLGDGLAARAAWADSCLNALSATGVRHTRVERAGVAQAVRIDGPIRGIAFQGPGELIIDCSLAVSLAHSAPLLHVFGVEKVRFSSALQRRTIRGTSTPSKHSYGLAIDIHAFIRRDGSSFSIQDDFEQGLGTVSNCLGSPMTEDGAILKSLECGFRGAGLFRYVLTPDFDGDHFDHFHLEVVPWVERTLTGEETHRGFIAMHPPRLASLPGEAGATR